MTEKQTLAQRFSPVQRRLSLVAQVELMLRDMILNDSFPSRVLPPLAELSQRFSVSRETVRLALNSLEEEGIVARQGRSRVLVTSSGSFFPQVAPSLVLGYLEEEYEQDQGDAEVVGGPQSRRMLEGAIDSASQHGYQLIVRRAKPFRLREAFREMRSQVKMSGIIFCSVSDEQFLKEMCRKGIPAVMLDHELYLPRFDSIRPDSKQNAKKAVDHLVELGHRRIVCASWLQTDINPWFIQGYREALRDAKISLSKDYEIEVRLNETGAREVLHHIFSLTPQPTAVICFNNTFASQVIAVAATEGLSVPGDLSVIGGGGESVAQLTSTNVAWPSLGSEATEILLNAIEEGKHHKPEHRLVPYELSVHGSTAPPRAD